jgi:segregation and condensation protein B
MESTTIRLATKLEAILYVKAQPLSINTLAEIAGCDRDDIELGLIELMQDYAQRDGALELVETDAGFSLQLRASCQSLIDKLVPTDIGVGALRTLAAIALRGPIAQTDLVELRGSGAYQHVQELVERGFVQKRRQSNGRSYKVQVTEQFYQYFEVDKLPTVQGASAQQIPLPLADAEGAIAEESLSESLEEPLSEPLAESLSESSSDAIDEAVFSEEAVTPSPATEAVDLEETIETAADHVPMSPDSISSEEEFTPEVSPYPPETLDLLGNKISSGTGFSPYLLV